MVLIDTPASESIPQFLSTLCKFSAITIDPFEGIRD